MLCNSEGDVVLELIYRKLRPEARVPTHGSAYAAGYDLYACIESPVVIPPHSTASVGTGLAFEVPPGWFAAIFARSGMAFKRSLRPANCVGVCDSDYRGEYIVALHNDCEEERVIEPGERIAQMVILPCVAVSFREAGALSETDRGVGGFGSTGA